MSLSILYDLTPYQHDSLSGSGRASINLLRELLLLDKENKYTAFGFESSIDLLKKCPRKFQYFYIPRQPLWGPFSREIGRRNFIAQQLRNRSIDIVHSNFDPIPVSGKTISVCFIYDVMLLNPRFKKHVKTSRRTKVRARLRYKLAAKSDHLLCDSKYTKGEIVSHLGIEADKITVVSLGVEKDFCPGEVDFKVLQKLGVRQPYILFVGRFGDQKNEFGLVSAFLSACQHQRFNSEVSLILIGKRKNMSKILSANINFSPYSDRIKIIDFADDYELVQLYRGALLLALPSFEEGFGLPALEAMACGTPVIVSNISSLPEVVGDAGLLISPDDLKAIEEALVSMSNNEKVRQKYAQLSLKQASQFSFKRGAESILKLYKELDQN